MSYNYSHFFVEEDLQGFSEYDFTSFDTECSTLHYGQSSLGVLNGATPVSDDSGTSRSVHAKVSIPRTSTAGISKPHSRVSRACEICREQKTKCSGHKPACHRCLQGNFKCSYRDRKREKTNKYVPPGRQSALLTALGN